MAQIFADFEVEIFCVNQRNQREDPFLIKIY